jgi:hypothetical protein
VPRGVTIRSVPAEAALGLTADFAGWRRGLAVVALAFSSFAIWRITHSYTQTTIFGSGRTYPIAGAFGFLVLANIGYSAAVGD